MIVSSRVAVRDDFGRFIADVEGAATKVVDDALDAGVATARSFAPERTGRLRASFVKKVYSRTQGFFTNTAPYAEYQDQGTESHPIDAHVNFFWEKAGRKWMWPETYLRKTGFPGADPIDHPGNPAIHFMDKGYDAAKRAARIAMHKYYG
jgi:hypothetical protein